VWVCLLTKWRAPKAILAHCPDLQALRVLQTWQPTLHDMVSWKQEVEEEREHKTGLFVSWALRLCSRLQAAGYWADFIDPSTGLAHFGQNSLVFVATEVGIQRLGYKMLDTGCCKVLVHALWGTKSFPATFFCTAPDHIISRCVAEMAKE
jgi:hypothetical protein